LIAKEDTGTRDIIESIFDKSRRLNKSKNENSITLLMKRQELGFKQVKDLLGRMIVEENLNISFEIKKKDIYGGEFDLRIFRCDANERLKQIRAR
jgi:hypothetical protein